MTYVQKKERAIQLREEGKTYSEILQQIPVAKSTLSLWLREIELSKNQIQRITAKRIAGQQKGAEARRLQRVERQRRILDLSENEITKISKRELWLLGIALYWAEGSKEKEYRPGSGIKFTNSDNRMIHVFLRWLESLNVPREQTYFEIYIHENWKHKISDIVAYWSKQTGFSKEHFTRIYFKRHNVKSNRRNQGNLYHGLLRVKVKASSTLVRRIDGWINGIYKHWGIV